MELLNKSILLSIIYISCGIENNFQKKLKTAPLVLSSAHTTSTTTQQPEEEEKYEKRISAASRQEFLLQISQALLQKSSSSSNTTTTTTVSSTIPTISNLLQFLQSSLRLKDDAPTLSEDDSISRELHDTLSYHVFYSTHFCFCAKLLVNFLLELVARDIMAALRELLLSRRQFSFWEEGITIFFLGTI